MNTKTMLVFGIMDSSGLIWSPRRVTFIIQHYLYNEDTSLTRTLPLLGQCYIMDLILSVMLNGLYLMKYITSMILRYIDALMMLLY